MREIYQKVILRKGYLKFKNDFRTITSYHPSLLEMVIYITLQLLHKLQKCSAVSSTLRNTENVKLGSFRQYVSLTRNLLIYGVHIQSSFTVARVDDELL